MPRDLAQALPRRLARHKLAFAARIVAYGFGDVVIAIRMTAFQFYLLPFYTDVVQLPSALAGLGRMLGLVWDGVNDPVTGYLSDRTSTRFGRRRPFLLASAIPLGLTFGLLWAPPSGMGPGLAFLYLVLAYVVLDTFFTLYATPYLALGAEISEDYHVRTNVSAVRSFFHVLGLFAGGVVPGLVLRDYTDARGYAVMGFGIGAFMICVALLTGLLAPEPPAVASAHRVSFRAFVGGLRSTLANRPFRIMVGAFGLILVGGGVHQTLVPYAFRYWLRRPAETVVAVIAIYLLATIVSLPVWTYLARRIGKDRALRLCIGWSVVALALLPVAFSPEMGNLRLGIFLMLAGLGNGGWSVLPAAITADIVDYDELGTAERRAGAYFGVWTLVMKLAAAVAAGIVGLALQLLSYVPNEVQAPGTILGIRLLYGPVPALFLLAALAVFWRFPLTRDRHREVQAALARVRSR